MALTAARAVTLRENTAHGCRCHFLDLDSWIHGRCSFLRLFKLTDFHQNHLAQLAASGHHECPSPASAGPSKLRTSPPREVPVRPRAAPVCGRCVSPFLRSYSLWRSFRSPVQILSHGGSSADGVKVAPPTAALACGSRWGRKARPSVLLRTTAAAQSSGWGWWRPSWAAQVSRSRSRSCGRAAVPHALTLVLAQVVWWFQPRSGPRSRPSRDRTAGLRTPTQAWPPQDLLPVLLGCHFLSEAHPDLTASCPRHFPPGFVPLWTDAPCLPLARLVNLLSGFLLCPYALHRTWYTVGTQ